METFVQLLEPVSGNFTCRRSLRLFLSYTT